MAHCQFLSPQMPMWRLGACWRAYEASGDGLFAFEQFMFLVRQGHIVCAVVLGPDRQFALFGLELMRDRDGPYTSFLFFNLEGGRLKDIAALVIHQTYKLARAYDTESRYGRLLLRGRDGWPRMLRRLGLEIDDRGFIHENQKAFLDGCQQRLN